MKKIICILSALIAAEMAAQNVGINPGGTTPNASSILDLNTGNTFTSPNGKGLIIPNVALTGTGDATTVNTPFTSLLVYNTATAGAGSTAVAPGFYWWNGTKWVALAGNGSNNWSLTGNAGTTVGTNFLGTTDNQDLQFNVNNFRSGLIDIANTQTFFGYQAGVNTLAAGNLNSFFGYFAGLTNTTGNCNTLSGFSALRFNSTGSHNSMFGLDAGYALTGAGYNTAMGSYSLEGFVTTPAGNTGVANTALGFCAGSGYSGVLGSGTNNNLPITTGSYNTFLGYSTDMTAGTYSNTTTVGAFAQAGASNVLILGGVAGTNGCTTTPNVGIGTTTPSALLHLHFSSNDLTYLATQGLRITNASTTNGTYSNIKFASYDVGGTNVYGAMIGSVINNHNVGAVAGDMFFHTTVNTGSVERMRITSAGNVGIGTSNPEVTLHVATETVAGNPRCMINQYCANNSNSAFFILRKGRGTTLAPTVVANGDQLGTVLSEAYDGTAFIRTGASIKFTCNGAVAAGSVPTDLCFITGSSGLGTEWMRILSTGNVGIATSAPTQALQIGDLTSIPSATPKTIDLGGSYSSTPGANMKVRIYDDGTNVYGIGVSAFQLDYSISNNNINNRHVFYYGTTELVRIQGNGFVGIGTPAPGYLLSVNGQPGANGFTAFTNYSDARLKKNVNNVEKSLDKIMQLRPVTFNYNEKYLAAYDDTTALTKLHRGFIAQEVKEVFPEMVGTSNVKGTDYLDLNLSNLQVYMVKAMQEQQQIIVSQKEEIELMKQRIAAMEKKMNMYPVTAKK